MIYSIMQIGNAFTSNIPEVDDVKTFIGEENKDDKKLTEESEIEEISKNNDISQTEKNKVKKSSTSNKKTLFMKVRAFLFKMIDDSSKT